MRTEIDTKGCYIHYLRDGDNKPYGCVVMTREGKFGWSLCREKKGGQKADQFSYKMARRIALGRALCKRECVWTLPAGAVMDAMVKAKEDAYRWWEQGS